jgi:hypothetical protein
MELFIREVEKAEVTFPPLAKDEPTLRLSAAMRESWSSGRFWFNYAMRTSIDDDAVYWEALDDGKGREILAKEDAEQLADVKMEQFAAYLKEKKDDQQFE